MSSVKFSKALVAALIAVLACGALVLAGCSQGAASSKASSAASSSSSSSASSSSSSTSKSSSSTASTAASAATYTKDVEAGDPYAKGTHHAAISVQGYDPFIVTLDADSAPVTVSNFCKLANDGFYDGLNFYRFVEGFCMQGGSSNNSAAASNDGLVPIIGEFSENGVANKLADNFKKGTVAMARNSNPNSATSTFFVTLGSDSMVGQSLNGKYAAFGTIDENGMAVVDKIVANYLPNVSDAASGSIADTSKQAKITSIKVTD